MSRFKVKDNNDQWVDISANGVGVPSGGTQGQILAKRSGTSYDAGWVNPSGGVHVGPTAPSDAFTTIWLDTDEQGASTVSSVNGKNGTVTLDADDVGAMSEWELLWENASPSSDFSAQTVSIDLSEYDMVAIVACLDDLTSEKIHFVPINGIKNPMNYNTQVSNDCYFKTRFATASSTGIVFDNNTEIAIQYHTKATQNSQNKPLYIYGIKGVG